MLLLLILSMLGVLDTTKTKTQDLKTCYDRDYVEVSNVAYEGENYSVVYMQRSGERVRAKYFAAKDYYGNSLTRFVDRAQITPRE